MQKTPSNVENKITWRKIICKNILYGTKQEAETIQEKLLFPVIAWYGIIPGRSLSHCPRLLFPVIAWYGIIFVDLKTMINMLLFPVIAWYGIIVSTSISSGL